MESTDLTIEILKSIRDEIRETNSRLDLTRAELSERLDLTRAELSERLDLTRTELSDHLDRLERRQTETEVRLATELVELSTAVTDVGKLLKDRLDLRDRIEDHELRLASIERRVS